VQRDIKEMQRDIKENKAQTEKVLQQVREDIAKLENFCKVQIIFCTSEFTILACNYLPKVISSGFTNCK
jgi:hypothetical protein